MRPLRLCLIVTFIVLGAARAEALVVMDPGMAHACPQGKTWDIVEKCLKQQGTVKLLRSAKGVRLIGLRQRQGQSMVDAGAYLYVERAGRWQLGGQFESNGGDYELLEFRAFTANKHAGFRIDIGQSSLTGVQQSDGTVAIGTLRIHHVMFCNALGWMCTDVPVSCEVLVRGKAVFVFRGALQIADNVVEVHGDRGYAGPPCSSGERVHLGWQP